jgi:hypothetical protein
MGDRLNNTHIHTQKTTMVIYKLMHITVMEKAEQNKVKYTHSRDTLKNPFEHQLRY